MSFGHQKNTYALRERDLPNKILHPFKETATKSLVELLTIERLKCKFPFPCIRHPENLGFRVSEEPVRHPKYRICVRVCLLPKACRFQHRFRSGTRRTVITTVHTEFSKVFLPYFDVG